jgi:sporulation protein YlmC with PRC-barrel domain
MAKTTQFTIGAEARCSDGTCGEVTRVVLDPIAEEVTHLVVEPSGRQGLGRLVPLELIDAGAGGIRLRCTVAEFTRLDSAEETQFVPGTAEYEAYDPEQVLSWPYYGLGMGDAGLSMGDAGLSMGNLPAPVTVTLDTVPLGEVTVRRGDPVQATDGDIGRVQGLVIDRDNHHVTHVLLQEGHLWGRKEVAIPIGAVASTETGIQLTITKHDVQNLPPVQIDHPRGHP